MEKKLEGQEDMAIRFIYLETAYSYNPKKNDYGNTGVP